MILDTAAGLSEQKDDDLVVVYRPSFAEETWNELAPLLERAFEYSYGEYSLNDMYLACRNEHANLWGYYVNEVPHLAMVTTIVTYPGTRYLHIMALGGRSLRRVAKMWNVMETFMQCNACVRATANVRPAIARMLQYHGFREMYTVVGRQGKGVH